MTRVQQFLKKHEEIVKSLDSAPHNVDFCHKIERLLVALNKVTKSYKPGRICKVHGRSAEFCYLLNLRWRAQDYIRAYSTQA